MPLRTMLAALAALSVAAQAGCATQPPTGDANGGTIDWFAATRSQVAASAEEHCARYGKKGRLINVESDRSGGHAVFSCEPR